MIVQFTGLYHKTEYDYYAFLRAVFVLWCLVPNTVCS
jgi:hypothetical protein